MMEATKRPLLMVKPELVTMIDEWDRVRGSSSDLKRRQEERERVKLLPCFDRHEREISIGDKVRFTKKQKNRKTTDGQEYEVLSMKRYCETHTGGEIAILCDDGKIRGYSTRQVEIINPKKLSQKEQQAIEVEQFSHALASL